MTRKRLLKQIENKEEKVQKLQQELIELKIKELKFCDKDRTYKEGIEVIAGKEILRGRVCFEELFSDEDSGEVISIEREQIVMENNKWFI